MPIEVSAFSCQYCKKLCKNHTGAILHERSCGQNPINDNPCFSCIHMVKTSINEEKVDAAFYHDLSDRYYNVTHTDFHCTLLDLHLKTRKIRPQDEKIHPHELQFMPPNCDKFKFGHNPPKSIVLEMNQ